MFNGLFQRSEGSEMNSIRTVQTVREGYGYGTLKGVPYRTVPRTVCFERSEMSEGKPTMKQQSLVRQRNDPSPEEIARLCAEIQKTWSPREKLSRLRVDWRPSFMRSDGFPEAMPVETYDAHHEARAALQETIECHE